MKKLYKILIFSLLCFLTGLLSADAQATIKGKVVDGDTGEELIGAGVSFVRGGTGGIGTDYEGNFVLKADALPVLLKFTYTGYDPQEVEVTNLERLTVKLLQAANILTEAVVKGQRIDDKQKAAPLTVENLDAIAIKETAAVSFYNGLGNLKGVDMTTASLGFTVINTRGFNSTSPVRSLQIIDGVDNQAPGLNFSLGNFLGASDLDVNKVDLVVGASSSFYGPNAFNGVISMETKNPFVHQGLAVSLKAGERSLLEGAMRYAKAVKNKSGKEYMAFKVNLFGLRADDWEADNYDPVTGSAGNQVFKDISKNPGRYNAVNIYGDEPSAILENASLYDARAGLNSITRTGYREVDLVDYNTRNLKAGAALHFRLNPAKEFESPELILASNFGTGTTVYQGDNRFSLKNLLFFQNRIELRKKDRFFVRFYSTNEDAGDSYDPYFTALLMQRAQKSTPQWKSDYDRWWTNNSLGAVFKEMKDMGYGPPDPDNPNKLIEWQQNNAAWLAEQHRLAAEYANQAQNNTGGIAFFQPGTARFDSMFQALTTRKNTEGGTLFYDKSALYHGHGEYRFSTRFLDDVRVGANGRVYRPVSDGTIFSDSSGRRITNSEFGVYVGAEKKVNDLRFSVTARVDKNQNFDYLATPAASVVWNPSENNYLRISFSSAIRNPTLTDQYLNLRVGPATLVGNLNGFDSLCTVESIAAFREDVFPDIKKLRFNNLDPIRPEKVKTIELGYRTTLFQKMYMDLGYYYNFYTDFIGYNIGATFDLDPFLGINYNTLEIWRVASNASQRVTTQGVAVGLNYYFGKYFMAQGNYSWNRLNTEETDPIVPAFNTPEHKYNLGLSARDIPLRIGSKRNVWGFNINYKWIEGFIFEGSPQFTGQIPTYSLMDAQVNVSVPKINSTLKIGASNVLNNKQFQVYGGPRIGRMGYVSLLYDFKYGK
jgi:iron complex outermembrane recepter protein